MSSIERIEQLLNETSVSIESALEVPSKVTEDDLKSLRVQVQDAHAEIQKSLKGSVKPSVGSNTLNRIMQAVNRIQDDKSAQIKVGAVELALFYEAIFELQDCIKSLHQKKEEKKIVSKIDSMEKMKKYKR